MGIRGSESIRLVRSSTQKMAASNSAKTTPAEKFCIACKEPIPADATVRFHGRARLAPEKESEPKRLFGGLVLSLLSLASSRA